MLQELWVILQNVPQVDGAGEADGAPRGPPGKLFAPLDAGEGSFYVFDPKFSLLHMRRLEEMIVLLFRGYLEHQLREEGLVSRSASRKQRAGVQPLCFSVVCTRAVQSLRSKLLLLLLPC